MTDLPDPKCRVCRGRDILFLCETPCRYVKSKVLHHYRCRHCGSAFIGDDIDDEEFGAAYSALDEKEYYREIEDENKRKMASAVNDLKQMVSSSASIIDIGTGNGLFVTLLHEAGMSDVCAHEIPGGDLSAIDGIARNAYQDYDYGTIPSDRFDVVTLLDVVEHVPDPQYLLESCNRILKTNGVVYCHVPVVTRIDQMAHLALKFPVLRKIGRMWQSARTSIWHLQIYTRAALRFLLENAGFRDVTIEVRNELSWPVSRFIRVYVLDRLGLPRFLAPVLLPIFYPLFATRFLNANKGIVHARKA